MRGVMCLCLCVTVERKRRGRGAKKSVSFKCKRVIFSHTCICKAAQTNTGLPARTNTNRPLSFHCFDTAASVEISPPVTQHYPTHCASLREDHLSSPSISPPPSAFYLCPSEAPQPSSISSLLRFLLSFPLLCSLRLYLGLLSPSSLFPFGSIISLYWFIFLPGIPLCHVLSLQKEKKKISKFSSHSLLLPIPPFPPFLLSVSYTAAKSANALMADSCKIMSERAQLHANYSHCS